MILVIYLNALIFVMYSIVLPDFKQTFDMDYETW